MSRARTFARWIITLLLLGVLIRLLAWVFLGTGSAYRVAGTQFVEDQTGSLSPETTLELNKQSKELQDHYGIQLYIQLKNQSSGSFQDTKQAALQLIKECDPGGLLGAWQLYKPAVVIYWRQEPYGIYGPMINWSSNLGYAHLDRTHFLREWGLNASVQNNTAIVIQELKQAIDQKTWRRRWASPWIVLVCGVYVLPVFGFAWLIGFGLRILDNRWKPLWVIPLEGVVGFSIVLGLIHGLLYCCGWPEGAKVLSFWITITESFVLTGILSSLTSRMNWKGLVTFILILSFPLLCAAVWLKRTTFPGISEWSGWLLGALPLTLILTWLALLAALGLRLIMGRLGIETSGLFGPLCARAEAVDRSLSLRAGKPCPLQPGSSSLLTRLARLPAESSFAYPFWIALQVYASLVASHLREKTQDGRVNRLDRWLLNLYPFRCERASTYCQEEAQKALRNGDADSAARLAEEGLEILQSLKRKCPLIEKTMVSRNLYRLLGDARIQLGKPDAAKEAILRAREIVGAAFEGLEVEPLMKLGRQQFEIGNFAGALPFFTDVVQILERLRDDFFVNGRLIPYPELYRKLQRQSIGSAAPDSIGLFTTMLEVQSMLESLDVNLSTAAYSAVICLDQLAKAEEDQQGAVELMARADRFRQIAFGPPLQNPSYSLSARRSRFMHATVGPLLAPLEEMGISREFFFQVISEREEILQQIHQELKQLATRIPALPDKELLWEASENLPEAFWQSVQGGWKSLCQEEYEQALKYYWKALQIEPRSARLHAAIGYIIARRKDLHRAAAWLNRAVELDPCYGWAQQQLARVYGQVEDTDSMMEALAPLSQVLEQQAEPNALVEYLRSILREDPLQDEAWLALGPSGIGDWKEWAGYSEAELSGLDENGKRRWLFHLGEDSERLIHYSWMVRNEGMAVLSHHPERARELFLYSLKSCRMTGTFDRLADIWLCLAELGLKQGLIMSAFRLSELAQQFAEETGNTDLKLRANLNLGRLWRLLHNEEEAVSQYEAGINVIEEVRLRIANPDARMLYTGARVDAYAEQVELLLSMGRTGQALEYVERSKSRALIELLGNHKIRVREGADRSLIEQDEVLQRELLTLERRLAGYGEEPDGDQRSGRRGLGASQIQKPDQPQKSKSGERERLAAVRQELARVKQEIRERTQEWTTLRVVPHLPFKDPSARDDLRRQMLEFFSGSEEKVVLVEYFVTEEKTFIFVTPCWETTDSNLVVEEAALGKQELNRIKNQEFGEAVVQNKSRPEFLERLYEKLFKPIKSHLDRLGAAVLMLAPHSDLHALPLHALCYWTAEHELRYLIEDYACAYVPSISVLHFLAGKRVEKQGEALVVGNPEPPGDLEFGELEAQRVADLLGTRAVLRKEAREDFVKREAISKRVIHLACHGEFNPRDALQSHLVMADGLLQVDEVLDMELEADLVTLSACSTGVSRVSGGDELVGMTRAWLYAGTPSVIASLWNVNDESTLQLMTAFYQKWRNEGKSKVRALQEAQVEWINQRRQAPAGRFPEGMSEECGGWRAEWNPHYWAPFILVGDPL